MWYFIKQSIFLVGLMFFMMTTCLLILRLDVPWGQLILSLLNLALYLTAIFLIFYKEGQTAWKLRKSNDFDRMTIIKTGKDIKINSVPEYKPWKGFIFGIIATAPLMIMLIVHAFVGGNTVGSITGVIHYVFYLPYYALRCCFNPLYASETCPMPFGDYFWLLYSVVLMSCVTALGYNLGARKLQRAQDKIEDRKEEIERGLF